MINKYFIICVVINVPSFCNILFVSGSCTINENARALMRPPATCPLCQYSGPKVVKGCQDAMLWRHMTTWLSWRHKTSGYKVEPHKTTLPEHQKMTFLLSTTFRNALYTLFNGGTNLRDGPLMIWEGLKQRIRVDFFSWPTGWWVFFPGQPADEFFFQVVELSFFFPYLPEPPPQTINCSSLNTFRVLQVDNP